VNASKEAVHNILAAQPGAAPKNQGNDLRDKEVGVGTNRMSNVCLTDFAENELEAFLSGRSDGIPTSPEDGLQLLADVVTATTDNKSSLPCHYVQVEFRPRLTGSDRVPAGPRPGTSRVKAGSEPGLGREYPWYQCPGFTGSGQALTKLKPGESWEKAGSELDTDWGHPRRRYLPCPFGHGQGLEEEGQAQTGHEDRRRRARMGKDDRGFRPRRYRLSSSDGGSEWGRENPSSRNGQPANCVKGNRQVRRCSDLTTGGERWPASPNLKEQWKLW